MCGRFEFNLSDPYMQSVFKDLQGRHNYELLHSGEIFPTDSVPALVMKNGAVVSEILTWGYEKFNEKGVIINARSETVTEKPMFRRDFFERRCLLPASGFYEWSPEKRKYLFSRPDVKPVFLGGFYKKQSDKKAFIILTKEATAPVSRFHNRIPILIDEANIEDWLGDIDFAFYYVQTDYPSALVFHS